MSHLNREVWLRTQVSLLALTLDEDTDWSLARWWWTPNFVFFFKLWGRGTEGRCPQDKDRALTGTDIQNAHYLAAVLCFPVWGWIWGAKICRLETVQWETKGSTSSFPGGNGGCSWLGQRLPAQETYPLPTDDGDTLSCALGEGHS